MEGRPAAQPVRTHPALNGLLQLQTGATYGVSSASLAALLMAGPSIDGAWCAVVGTGELGVEAAAMFGVDLDRVVVVPEPGDAWLEVVAALVDVLGLVVVRPPQNMPAPKDISRLSARLRTRGSILVVWGDWPRCDARRRAHRCRVARCGLGQRAPQGAAGDGRGAQGHVAGDAASAVAAGCGFEGAPVVSRVALPRSHLNHRIAERVVSADDGRLVSGLAGHGPDGRPSGRRGGGRVRQGDGSRLQPQRTGRRGAARHASTRCAVAVSRSCRR